MRQIKIRWGDLGPPTEPGTYRLGSVMVDVTPGDIKLANGKNDAVFTAIHPDFYSEETPYLLTGVDLPSKRPLEAYLPNRPSETAMVAFRKSWDQL
jgi:hypothetical protein